ncbi:MAG: hypothetical protein K6B72_05510 [Lachnospiraceae bacterium]|nr:hypothetical protein [Lachnospiraceae bacterium]
MSGSMMKTAKAEHKSADFESRYMNSGSIAESEHAPAPSRGPEIRESVSYGEEQGGLRDWFRKRKMDKMQISEPTLKQAVSHVAVGDSSNGGHLRDEYTAGFDGPISEDELKYQDFLGSDVLHIDREMAHDPKIQQRALNDFIQGTRQTIAGEPNQEQALVRLRSKAPGMRGMSHILGGVMPEGFSDQIYQLGKIHMQGMDEGLLQRVRDDSKISGHMEKDMLESGEMNDVVKMNSMRQVVYGMTERMVNQEGSEVGDFLGRAQAAFEGTPVQDEDMQSAFLMNMLMNRVVAPVITPMARATEKDPAMVQKMEEYNRWLENGAKFSLKGIDNNPRKGFLTSLKSRFHKGAKPEDPDEARKKLKTSSLPSASGLFD